jgi:hypothetical protein
MTVPPVTSTESKIKADITRLEGQITRAASRVWNTVGISSIALVVAVLALLRTCH